MATLLICWVGLTQDWFRREAPQRYRFVDLAENAGGMFGIRAVEWKGEICREGEVISKTDLREMQNHQAQRQYQSNL